LSRRGQTSAGQLIGLLGTAGRTSGRRLFLTQPATGLRPTAFRYRPWENASAAAG